MAAGVLDPYYKPKFENTTPVAKIGPFPQWYGREGGEGGREGREGGTGEGPALP